MQTTQLAHGKITNADTLTIELIQPPDMPPAIWIRWPDKPSLCPPAQFDAALVQRVRRAATLSLRSLATAARESDDG